MLLTEQEKKKFTEYLEQEIMSANMLVEQMEKMRVPQQLVMENKALASACRIVRNRINSGESFSVGGKHGDQS